MKTRNGFVSNSSSSSFVVSFPKKPTDFADVYEMMFSSKNGKIQPYDFVDGLTHAQVAERVWGDIKELIGKKKDEYQKGYAPATLSDIAEIFSYRYHYYPKGHSIFWQGRANDELGGAWDQEVGQYFGSDTNSLNKLRDFIIKTENEEKEIRNKQREVCERDFKMNRPQYAYKGGKDNKTGKPYTKKQIKAQDDFESAMTKFRTENKEYSQLEKKINAIWQKKFKTERILRDKIAKADAKAFMLHNKNAFSVILSYGDEDGNATLEHGNIFKNLPHVTISQH